MKDVLWQGCMVREVFGHPSGGGVCGDSVYGVVEEIAAERVKPPVL